MERLAANGCCLEEREQTLLDVILGAGNSPIIRNEASAFEVSQHTGVDRSDKAFDVSLSDVSCIVKDGAGKG